MKGTVYLTMLIILLSNCTNDKSKIQRVEKEVCPISIIYPDSTYRFEQNCAEISAKDDGIKLMYGCFDCNEDSLFISKDNVLKSKGNKALMQLEIDNDTGYVCMTLNGTGLRCLDKKLTVIYKDDRNKYYSLDTLICFRVEM